MKKQKIKINKVLPEVFKQKGYSDGAFEGCINCPCGPKGEGDICCHYGCDVDKESYDLMFKNKKEIEKLIGRKLEDCFVTGFKEEPEFLGGGFYRAGTREDTFCVFHNLEDKGCALVKLVLEKKKNWRLVPTICKTYPITWDKGVLGMYTQLDGGGYEVGCDCFRKENKTKKSVWETQKEFVEDIFEINEDKLNKR